MSNAVTGNACKLYYNTGTDATPTWVEVTRAKDVSAPLSKGEADVSRRESNWKMSKGTLKEGGLEFGYQYKLGSDSVFDALVDSYLNGTPIQFAVMDQAIATSGAWGFKLFSEVMELPIDQPLEDGVVINVSAKPTDHEESGSLVEPDFIQTA